MVNQKSKNSNVAKIIVASLSMIALAGLITTLSFSVNKKQKVYYIEDTTETHKIKLNETVTFKTAKEGFFWEYTFAVNDYFEFKLINKKTIEIKYVSINHEPGIIRLSNYDGSIKYEALIFTEHFSEIKTIALNPSEIVFTSGG